MNIRIGLPALLVVLAVGSAAGSATAQVDRPAEARRQPIGMARGLPLLEQALRRQDELGLTAGQRTELAAVKSRLDQANAPLLEQLRAAGEVSREARDSTRVRPGARQQ